jgi:hypothetical protein
MIPCLFPTGQILKESLFISQHHRYLTFGWLRVLHEWILEINRCLAINIRWSLIQCSLSMIHRPASRIESWIGRRLAIESWKSSSCSTLRDLPFISFLGQLFMKYTSDYYLQSWPIYSNEWRDFKSISKVLSKEISEMNEDMHLDKESLLEVLIMALLWVFLSSSMRIFKESLQ